jgi:hypothetical protein
MSLADVPPPTVTASVDRPPAPVAATIGRRAMSRPQRRARPGAQQLLGIAFALAWLAAPAVEPMPTDPETEYPLWQLPIDVAAVVTIVAAVAALWRGSRHAARLGIAAGVLMAVETIVCPLAGHTPVGWWTWAQTGLSLFVLLSSAALASRQSDALSAPAEPESVQRSG